MTMSVFLRKAFRPRGQGGAGGIMRPRFTYAYPIPMTRYRHYKGGIYEFVGDAILESDLSPMVVYRAADGRLWIRPQAVFHEMVEVDGKQLPRFEKMAD
jgi:hypothetical protein